MIVNTFSAATATPAGGGRETSQLHYNTERKYCIASSGDLQMTRLEMATYNLD